MYAASGFISLLIDVGRFALLILPLQLCLAAAGWAGLQLPPSVASRWEAVARRIPLVFYIPFFVLFKRVFTCKRKFDLLASYQQLRRRWGRCAAGQRRGGRGARRGGGTSAASSAG
jgi:hypothetical protein